MSDIINQPPVHNVTHTAPELSIWQQFTQGEQVFIMDRSTVVAGPYTDTEADMEDARSQYTVLVSTVSGPNPYRIANLVTRYRLVITPHTFCVSGKELDL